ncbi:MAG: hypothetical protein E6Q36_00210 [Chryseobacterium sp.]|nr:MAG: hypothetical protein E6Q36_00210 [Chryseobacterium sp.]
MNIKDYYFEEEAMMLLKIRWRPAMAKFVKKNTFTTIRLSHRTLYLRSEIDREVAAMIELMPEHLQFAATIEVAKMKLAAVHNCDIDLTEWLPCNQAAKIFNYSRRALTYLASYKYGQQIRTVKCKGMIFYYKPDIERYNRGGINSEIHPLKRSKTMG